MRQVALQMSVSVDGFVAGPHGGLGGADEHEDVVLWKLAALRRASTHIMGRTTYEQMAAYWPSATSDYAAVMNGTPKVVFSKTLEKAEWPESRIAAGDLAEEITNLKRQPGTDIMVHGGASFVQSLARFGLIDEYRLVIRPVALGSGRPMFADLPAPMSFTLAAATSYPDGITIHVYQPV
jgi:dihydrofolate reductase